MKFFAISLSTLFLVTPFAFGQDFISDTVAIRVSYSDTAERKLKGESTEIGINQWAIMSPIFYRKAEGWSFGAGFRYESSDLAFSNALMLDEDSLHSLDLPLFLSKEQSDKLEWMFLFNTTAAGDYEQINGDLFNFLALGGAHYKKSATFEWFFGAVYITGFDDNLFLPAIGIHWKPSKQTDFFFAGPYLRYRYSLNDSIDLILGGNLSGNRWNTEAGYGERDFRLLSYRLSFTLQWNLDEEHAIFASMGTEFAREVKITNAAGTTLLEKDLGSAPHFEIGYRFRL